MQVGRLMLQKKPEGIMNFLLGNHMVVVKDKQTRCCPGGHGIDQRGQDRLDREYLRRAQMSQSLLADPLVRGIQCCKEVGPEAYRVIVTFIEGDPGHRSVFLCSRL